MDTAESKQHFTDFLCCRGFESEEEDDALPPLDLQDEDISDLGSLSDDRPTGSDESAHRNSSSGRSSFSTGEPPAPCDLSRAEVDEMPATVSSLAQPISPRSRIALRCSSCGGKRDAPPMKGCLVKYSEHLVVPTSSVHTVPTSSGSPTGSGHHLHHHTHHHNHHTAGVKTN